MSNTTERLKVEEYDDLVRDTKSLAVINTNLSAYNKAKERADAAQRERDELRNATREINNIKCEMHEIKDLLTQLVNKEN
jgi:hypothetical protein|tara:strand:- start:127 stop:366 length:240 start_codon:yes stop_codon:yes gene_type:complete